MNLHKKYKSLLNGYFVNTPLRLAHFFAQLSHESNLLPISENLNYTPKRLLQIFSKYFTASQANFYARKPENIASRVYANRMGNGDEGSGDGWKYRGRGFIQLTGKDNYAKVSKATGVDYLKNPDLLLNEADAMIVALWYWNVNKLNSYADKDDIDAISDIINIGRPTERYGDSHGFKDRKAKLKKFKIQFKK